MIDDFLSKVICEDALTVLRTMPDKSIDLVLTDPPYELNWTKGGIHFKNRKSMYAHLSETQQWDVGVRELYPPLFAELNRLVKDSGSVIMFTHSNISPMP